MQVRTDLKHKNLWFNSLKWVIFLLNILWKQILKFSFLFLKIIYLFFISNNKIDYEIKKDSQRKKNIFLISLNRLLYKFIILKHEHLSFNLQLNVDQAELKTILKAIFFFYLSFKDYQNQINKILFKNRFIFSFTRLFKPIRQLIKLKYSFGIPSRFVFGTLIISGFLLVGSFYYLILKDLPNPNELNTKSTILSTKIYARDGSLLYKIYRNQNRSLVKLNDIPQNLINATIAIEDKDFWSHAGFSLSGIVRAVQKNLNDESYSQGGSTITQQLVKNVLLSPEKTFSRKLKELVLAIEVELIFSKKDILQMYFNEIPYGGIAYGAEEASETYFGKSVKDLNLAEAAFLAGIPTAPTRYSPFGAHPEYTISRQHHVLDRMQENGFISPEEKEKAKKTKIFLKQPNPFIKAPHFVMYVKELLVEKYGTRMVEEGGLEVFTSLDPHIQETAERSVADELNKLAGMQVTNGAVIVTHPQTGEILAMVGSRDYFDTKYDGNVNVTTQLRQPGSSIKPLTYALALRSGLTPISKIEDSPVSYPDGDKNYSPVNYDGRYHGQVTLKTALGSSFNIPAVKLLNKLGVNNLIDFAKEMGITTWNDRSRFGLSLTLGGGEVRMTDMATVYGVFANQGLKVDLHPILQVKTPDGKILQDFYCNPNFNFLPEVKANDKVFCQPQAVLSPLIAYQISDMLSDNIARIPAFGPNSLLNIPNHQVAVKTGTTNDKRDNWAIGFVPDYVVVTWVGNNDNSPMSNVTSGITGATPIWNTIMADILKRYETTIAFSPPNGLIPIKICTDNGLLACQGCKNIKTEYFIPGTQPKVSCNMSPSPSPEGIINYNGAIN